ncbi:MAG: hypothetical protein K2O04_02515 [Clostridiales bacterium]|nr:hypothetical protein [Clostridiales bacterium]
MNIDTVDFVMGLLTMLILCGAMEAIIIYQNHKKWIREGKTVEFFPAWKGTNKPFHWFLGWSIAKCISDLFVIFLYAFIIVNIYGVVLLALIPIVWMLFALFQMVIYAISETLAVSIVRRKNPQPNEEASNTDVIADGVIGNEEADLTDEE